ncbi:MAG: histidine kinase [Ferruginibacter sp.]
MGIKNTFLVKKIITNFLLWVGFVFAFGFKDIVSGKTSVAGVFIDLFFLILSLGPVVYFHNLYLLPKFFYKKKYLPYIGIVFFIIFGYAALLVPTINYLSESSNTRDHTSYEDTVWIIFICLLIGAAFKIVKDFYYQQKRLVAIENEFLKSELAALRNQINPHFLFNTLNNLYGMIIEQSPHAKDVVLKLSETMRYVLYNSNGTYVPLMNELEYINDYLAIQKIRLRNPESIQVNYTIEEHSKALQIAPLLLIVFIENAFKHGTELTTKTPFITIDIKTVNKYLYVNISNQYVSSKKSDAGGIGLSNVKKRIQLLYGNDFEYLISPAEDNYTVSLKLPLHETKMPDSG